ncbi:unnamed protein product [Umbelopsis vinacea]
MPDIQPLTDDSRHSSRSNEQQLEAEQSAFVQAFENKITRDAEFAEQYKNLVQSRELHSSMKSNLDSNLANVCQQAKETAAVVQGVHSELQAYDEEKKNMKDTWESKRKAYLEEIRTKQQSFDKSHQKELDKLDEKYAKLTRDSIYANLVGTDTWKYH